MPFFLLPLLTFVLIAGRAEAQTIVVSLTGGKSITNWHGQADIQTVTIEATKRWWVNTDVGFYAAPHTIWQPRSWFGGQYRNGNENVRGIGTGLVVRRHFRSGQRVRPYVELLGGPLWTEKQVPAATSQLNFATQPGAGLVLFPRAVAPVVLGYRFSHISNGGLSSRNPGWNVSSIVVGVMLGRRR